MIHKLSELKLGTNGGTMSHNSIFISPKIDGITILDLYMFDQLGERVNLISNPVVLNKPVSSRYDISIASSVYIDVAHQFAEDLDIKDMVNLHVSMASTSKYASISFDKVEMSFHKYISIRHTIENAEDSFINASIGLRGFDRYGNLQFNDNIKIGLSDDNVMVKHAAEGSSIRLDHKPLEDSVYVLIGGNRVNEFSIDGNIINIDIPHGEDCYVIYKPFFIGSGSFSSVSSNIMINSSNEIEILNKYCDKLEFSPFIEIFNTNVTYTNSTPVIKNISIVASER